MSRKIDMEKFKEFKKRYYPLIQSEEITKKEVAKIFGVSRVTINDWCRRVEREMSGEIDTENDDIEIDNEVVDEEEIVEVDGEIEEDEIEEDDESEPFDMILMKAKKDEDEEDTKVEDIISKKEPVKTEIKEQPRSIMDEVREIKKKMHKKTRTVAKTTKAMKEERDINYNFPRRATFEALDRSYAVMIRAYAERQKWLSEVIEELGMTALMMALQLAKIPPSEWYDKISEFKNPQAFIDFVNEYIVALFEAKEDASKILELRDENNMLTARVFYLEAQVETLTRKLRELYNYLNAATSLLTKEQLQRLILWNAIYQMQNAEVNKIERGYEINGDEETDGRERFE